MNYYNEFDPHAAQWIRNLIAAGHIPPGDVDERSIEDVSPNELRHYTQCHFFAGIAGWSHALALAGWESSRPVWTGSCPCQPFSAAGKGAGFDDQRHLWPAWFHLIRECRPPAVFGEQVASKAADPWIDLVHADLEGMGYAFGCVPFPAAGVGAPHIRDRNYWVGLADANDTRLEGRGLSAERSAQFTAGSGGVVGGLADADGRHASAEREQRGGQQRLFAQDGGVERVADSHGRERHWLAVLRGNERDGQDAGRTESVGCASARCDDGRTGPVNGNWRAADWLGCRDGKWRPVEASPQPLVDGLPESLGRVCAATIAEVEAEVVSYAAYRKTSAAEELRNLCEALDAQAQRGWSPGGLPDLHSPAFLLAFVCQLAAQGWRLAQGLPLSGSQAAGAGMRVLWDNEAAARASRQRGLEGQPARERTDALHLLSPVLARHAQASWGKAYSAYAEIGFPLGHNAPGRVGRLRGYGNAIVPQQAAEFVMAYMEMQAEQRIAA